MPTYSYINKIDAGEEVKVNNRASYKQGGEQVSVDIADGPNIPLHSGIRLNADYVIIGSGA